MIVLSDIRAALLARNPTALPDPPKVWQRASVAMILMGPPDALSLCFIQRAERESDRWSGQMAFPGGRASLEDPTHRAVAERETMEEIGLSLEAAELLGPLDEMPIWRQNRPGHGVLSPFVYHLGAGPRPTLTLNHEVASAHWIDLAHLWTDQHLTTVEYIIEDKPRHWPGIAYGERVIWGLSLRVLDHFAGVLGRPLPATHTAL